MGAGIKPPDTGAFGVRCSGSPHTYRLPRPAQVRMSVCGLPGFQLVQLKAGIPTDAIAADSQTCHARRIHVCAPFHLHLIRVRKGFRQRNVVVEIHFISPGFVRERTSPMSTYYRLGRRCLVIYASLSPLVTEDSCLPYCLLELLMAC